MKNKFLFFALITFIAFGCSSDPCEEADNVECETGDVDGDGIPNLTDTAPTDACSPEPDNLACPTGDFDQDGVSNEDDPKPEDPCVPEGSLSCPTGDVDMDGISNENDADPEDPCIPNDNLACLTGDLDDDGISNGEDPFPLDACAPNLPPFVEVIIGRWEWSESGSQGEIEINDDGTYRDIINSIISNGVIVERTWSIVSGPALRLDIVNSNGSTASIELRRKEYACDYVLFEGFFSDLRFDRLE